MESKSQGDGGLVCICILQIRMCFLQTRTSPGRSFRAFGAFFRSTSIRAGEAPEGDVCCRSTAATLLEIQSTNGGIWPKSLRYDERNLRDSGQCGSNDSGCPRQTRASLVRPE